MTAEMRALQEAGRTGSSQARRYMLLHQGYGISTEAMLHAIMSEPELRLLDRVGSDLVVEASADRMVSFVKRYAGWRCAPVRGYVRPGIL